MRHTDTEYREQRGTRIGYTRVSTVSQTLDQQNEALTAANVTKTFSDIMSGARDDRPGLAALMAYVRTGDTVVVWKLDRLGRNLWHILQTVKKLTERGVTLVSVTDGIDSSTAAGRMMIGVLGSLAEYERELTRERTALKRAASRVNGTKFGRPRKVDDADHIATSSRREPDRAGSGSHAVRRRADTLNRSAGPSIRPPDGPPWRAAARRARRSVDGSRRGRQHLGPTADSR